MFSPKQVRIGNQFVHQRDYMNSMYPVGHWKVNRIGPKTIKLQDFDISEMNAVALTPEILIHSNWTPFDNNVWQAPNFGMHIMQCVVSQDFNDGNKKWFVAILENETWRPFFKGFEFLHELQNIHFDLTGEEMDVKI